MFERGAQIRCLGIRSEETLICPTCNPPCPTTGNRTRRAAQVKKHRHGERSPWPANGVVRCCSQCRHRPAVSTIYDAHKVRSQVKKGGGIWGVLCFWPSEGCWWARRITSKPFPIHDLLRMGHAPLCWPLSGCWCSWWHLRILPAGHTLSAAALLFSVLAFARLDLHVLRGAFAAVVSCWARNCTSSTTSVLVNAQKSVDKFILDVGRLIERAGEFARCARKRSGASTATADGKRSPIQPPQPFQFVFSKEARMRWPSGRDASRRSRILPDTFPRGRVPECRTSAAPRFIQGPQSVMKGPNNSTLIPRASPSSSNPARSPVRRRRRSPAPAPREHGDARLFAILHLHGHQLA
jgi:hypothetical protein